ALLVILYQGVGAADGRLQVFRIASPLIQAQAGVAVFSDHVRFNVVDSVRTPALVIPRTGIGGGIGHARPRIIRGRGAVFEFVVEEVFKEGQHAGIAGVGIKPFDESLQHGAKVAGGVGPLLVRDEFVGGLIDVEAAVVVVQ